MATFERHMTLGWGVLGPTCSHLRRMARECGVEMAPLPWAKLAPEHHIRVEVTGTPEGVAAFENKFTAAYPS